MPKASKFTIAIRLRNEWKEASRLKDRHDGTFGTAEAEQKAWDALIDHVEASDLNNTIYDPAFGC